VLEQARPLTDASSRQKSMSRPLPEGASRWPEIIIDADGCPVKDEVYRVARRYGLRVILVSNARMRFPPEGWISLVVVEGQFDAADDWIAGHAEANDIVVTGDLPLAARCLAGGARVIGPKGRIFTDASIGDALANRMLMSHLREMGNITGGPAPFAKKDRSRFLQSLDETIRAVMNPG
jgi:uncharacterized protein YaiI (UPF0178 family)